MWVLHGVVRLNQCNSHILPRKMLNGLKWELEQGWPFTLDIYEIFQFIINAWTNRVIARTTKNCWEHRGLVQSKDVRRNWCPIDVDLEALVQGSDLGAQIKELKQYMSQFSLMYPITLFKAEWVQNAPIFSIDANIVEFSCRFWTSSRWFV